MTFTMNANINYSNYNEETDDHSPCVVEVSCQVATWFNCNHLGRKTWKYEVQEIELVEAYEPETLDAVELDCPVEDLIDLVDEEAVYLAWAEAR